MMVGACSYPWWALALAPALLCAATATTDDGNKPRIHSTANDLLITTPNDLVFELGTGNATERISVREMVTGIRSAIDELRVTADEVTSLRLNLTGVMDEVAADSATAARLLERVMVCAERNLTLGPGDACISPAVTCPRIPDHPNMSVVLSPEGLAYERLPGTMAEYSCYNGHVDRVGTRSYCTALGTWSSSPPANCSLCSEHLPHCAECGNGTCSVCRFPYVLDGLNASCVQPSTCADVETTGEYQLRLGFAAFCLVADGAKWMKISSWGTSYGLSTGARSGGECATARGRDCKLSDRDINLVVDASGERYYRLEADGVDDKMYLYTDRPYTDTAASWGVGPREAHGIVSDVFPGEELRQHGPSFTQNWIDFHYVTDLAYRRTTSCQRYMVGHGRLDCYSNSNCNCRCISGGYQCSHGRYQPVPNWSMYIAQA